MSSLVLELQAGNPRAISTFYKTYSPRILRYLTNHLPREAAEEVLSDVFLDAVDAIKTLQKDTNLQAWVFKIAHNSMVDYYRKQKIKSFLLSQIPYLEIIASEMHEPEFIYEKEKIKDKIEKAFQSLSIRYQQILRMHYEDDLPIKRIAVELEMTFKAAESMLYRARQNFIVAYERA